VTRGTHGPGRMFAATMIATVALALAPSSFLRAWTSDLSALLWLPLRPPAHGLTALRYWLRPPAESGGGGDAQMIRDERDRFRALWHAERLRAEGLSQRLSQIERVRGMDRGGVPVEPVLASVTGRGAGSSERFLVLNAGKRDGVQAGDPAVIGGDVLVGRVVGEPGEASCWLAPLRDASTGRLDVYIAPADRPEAPPSEGVIAQLRPNAQGLLVGEVDSAGKVDIGDSVRLADPTWKPSAQGMRVGVIRGLRKSDRNPLRSLIEVECEAETDRMRQVTLKVEVNG